MTPSYGRLYASPYVRACEIGSMLLGFNCTYNQSRDRGELMVVEPQPRLIKGPGYPSAQDPRSAIGDLPSTDWPTYRHDNSRSGVTAAAIPERPKVVWKVSLPGKPTAPVVADGILLTAVRDI